MRVKSLRVFAAVVVLGTAGAAAASHVTQVDPTTVPTGMLAAHNSIEKVPVRALARGFGHVHRAIAGPDGVDFYVTYVLPRGSATHVIAASVPAECS
jgi:hypothetical protein